MFARLEPFDSEETARYIAHRLEVAGYSGGPLFTPGALQIIHVRSRGIPRNISSLCFSALSLACAMGRKRVDSDIMREVVADRDLDFQNKPRLTPIATSTPVKPTTVLSYRYTGSKSWLPGWAFAAASFAALVAVGTLMLPFSSGRLGRVLHATTEASTSVRTAPTSKASSGTTSTSGLIPSLAKKRVEIPEAASVQPSSSRIDARTSTVVVLPGDTLRQIALRTGGKYSGKILKQIRKLNPGMTDPSHLEVGQEVRLPRFSTPFDSPLASGAGHLTGKN